MDESEVRYFVYELRDPRPEIRHPETLSELPSDLDLQTFYVGKSKTSQKRFRQHMEQARDGKHPCHRCHTISQIVAAGELPEMVTIATFENEAEALIAEAQHAARYPKSRLTNILEAGTTGWSASAETRARQSERMQGVVLSEQFREASRIAATGRPKTVEEVEKIRAKMKGRPLTEEHRAAVAAGVRARDPEVYVRIGDAMRGRRWKLTPEGEAKVIEMRLAHGTSGEIGAVVGLSGSHICQVIRDLIEQGRLPRPLTSAERLAKAAEIYNAGGGVDDVVKALDLGARSSGYGILTAAEDAGLITARSERPYSQDTPPRRSVPARQPRPARRRIPVTEWPAILDALDAGESQGQVAKRYNVTRTRIGQIAREACLALGREMPVPRKAPLKVPPELWGELAVLSEKRITLREIASRFGISPALACQILAQYRQIQASRAVSAETLTRDTLDPSLRLPVTMRSR